jgi:hypothetical protein
MVSVGARKVIYRNLGRFRSKDGIAPIKEQL